MSAERPWALPLVPLYRTGMAARHGLRALGWGRPQHLRWPVISVGSLSAGGAGKTPLVMAMANLLSDRGWTVDVLSRGYKRTGKGQEQVDLLAANPAQRFGDEPVLVAQRTGVPVWVGASRAAAGQAAEAAARDHGNSHKGAEVPLRVHLLDDGLQHRALARSFDLVLVTAADLKDGLLPAGNLREPLSALRRADAIAVRETELPFVERRVRAFLRPGTPLWTLRRGLRFPPPLGIFGAGLRPLAFCAIARPASFATMLAKAGCGVVDTAVFRDHHRYEDRDIAELIGLARKLQATGLVTTEKDAVKLNPVMVARLEETVGPLMVVPLDTHFLYEAPVVRVLEARLRPTGPAVPAEDEVRSH